ncbi:MAG: Fur family transcriptional regulator [Patescibacteria group bacterium]
MARQSRTRERIYKLFSRHHLLTPKEIMELIPDVNKTTIYRNLDSLVAERKLKELMHDKKSVSYELASHPHPHHHFICQDCGIVFPIEIPEEEVLRLFQSGLYSLEQVHIDLRGLCTNCKTRRQSVSS